MQPWKNYSLLEKLRIPTLLIFTSDISAVDFTIVPVSLE